MNAPVVVGDVIAGKYRVDRALGRGGMGMVFAASHLMLPQRVAIKFLLPSSSSESTGRFLREARAAVRLKGEHVVRVLDVGQLVSGLPYIVMEYLEGRDLSEVLNERRRLTVPEAVEVALHACLAMAEAHAAGIVHRDIKPANLFLTKAPDGTDQVKVLDFGVSKELPSGAEDSAAAITQPHEVLGSPLYMAPEQMRSSRAIDARVDIWALGALLYRCLTGCPPFQAETFTQLVLDVTGSQPRPLRELEADIPPELDRAVLRCLEKDPAQRFQSVAELAAAIVPFAPARAQSAADRVARILRVGRASVADHEGDAGRTSVAPARASVTPARSSFAPARSATEMARFATETTHASGTRGLDDTGTAPTERVLTGSSDVGRGSSAEAPRRRLSAYLIAGGVSAVGTALLVGAAWSRREHATVEPQAVHADAVVISPAPESPAPASVSGPASASASASASGPASASAPVPASARASGPASASARAPASSRPAPTSDRRSPPAALPTRSASPQPATHPFDIDIK